MIISLDWINSIPKIINNDGCWIPTAWKPNNDGYIDISIGSRRKRKRYYLHRLSMCAYYNLDYYDTNIVSRHSSICDKACFNFNHIVPGTYEDNSRDTLEQNKNFNLNKEKCPKCGGLYRNSYTISKGKRRWQRYCPRCQNKNRLARLWRQKK